MSLCITEKVGNDGEGREERERGQNRTGTEREGLGAEPSAVIEIK